MFRPALILSVFILILFAGPAWAGPWTVQWDGKTIPFQNPPEIINDRLYVPLRELAEKTGAQVAWDPNTSGIALERKDRKLSCRIDHTVASLNGQTLYLGLTPTILHDRTYVPVRFFSETLGLSLDIQSRTVTLREDPKAVPAAGETAPSIEAPLTFQLGQNRWTLHPRDIDMAYLPQAASGETAPAVIGFSDDKLRASLRSFSDNLREISGGIRQVDVEKALALATRAWTQGDLRPIPFPTITLQEEIGSYTTRFDPALANRTQNVRLAAESINNYRLDPGKTFSFNKTVGPRTVERGYKEAPIIVGNRYESGLGGGICQVSSTLYNAVEASGMTITERHSHSLPVSYIPKGRDATVAWGVLDFRFRNPLDTPIRLQTEMTEDGFLTIRVWKYL